MSPFRLHGPTEVLLPEQTQKCVCVCGAGLPIMFVFSNTGNNSMNVLTFVTNTYSNICITAEDITPIYINFLETQRSPWPPASNHHLTWTCNKCIFFSAIFCRFSNLKMNLHHVSRETFLSPLHNNKSAHPLIYTLNMCWHVGGPSHESLVKHTSAHYSCEDTFPFSLLWLSHPNPKA